MIVIWILVVGLALLSSIPVWVLFVEVFAGIMFSRKPMNINTAHQRPSGILIMIPAHNESVGIARTIASIRLQMHASDRLLVIADNCSDDTASVAIRAGAEVCIRDDPFESGKSYALAFGLSFAQASPPNIVVFIDADCVVLDHTIERLTSASAAAGRPAQALNLMISPQIEGSISLQSRVAEFAWRVKNQARPLGLNALGLPCQLMGTGMAIPWRMLQAVNLASGFLAEDLKLGFDLSLGGTPPIFCPSACVVSEFPTSSEGRRSQRERWERGHLHMISRQVLPLAAAAINRGKLSLLALALDAAVPPLTLLSLLTTVSLISTVGMALNGYSLVAMYLSLISLLVFAGSILGAWLRYGRDILPSRSVYLLIWYVYEKVALYAKMLRKKPPPWIRTDRTKL